MEEQNRGKAEALVYSNHLDPELRVTIFCIPFFLPPTI